MERFIQIKGFENYEISSLGNVKNKIKNRLLKPNISKRGYIVVKLVNKEVRKTKCIHRLMGIYFLNDGIDGDFIVDHIDNNKLNNNLSNLQLTTKRINSTKDRKSITGENCIYFSKSKNKTAYRVRIKIGKERKSFGTFNNINDAINTRNLILSKI